MNVQKQYLTNNDVYANNLGRIDSRYAVFQDEGPKGAMLHGVGYTQPNAEPIIKAWDKPGVEKAVHGFIEPETIYQTLPWNFRGWHAGGSANNTYIGVEMTEPPTIKYTGPSSWVDMDPVATEAFVRKTYANAVELFAFLCKEHGWDPLADGVIISHAEGHKRGVASNHGDPEHIWKKFGLSMDLFRAAVAEKLRADREAEAAPLLRVQAGAFRKLPYARELQEKLKAAGFDTYLVQAEDGLYKVQTGAYRKRPYAEEHLAKVKAAGFVDAFITTKSGKAVHEDAETPAFRTGTVTVSSSLNIRSGPGTAYSRTGKLQNGDKVTITEEQDGWGKLQQGGWVCLDYIT